MVFKSSFEVSVLYVLVDWVARNFKRYRMWFVGITSIIITIIGYVLKTNGTHIVTGVEETCFYFIFFTIGIFLHKVSIKKSIPDAIMVIVSASCLLISYQLLIHSLIPNVNAPVFYVANGCWGGLLLKGLAEILMRTRIAGIFEYMGRNSMHIMLWHFVMFKLVSICYIRIYDLPKYYLASFPVLKTQYWWIVYSVVGVLLPLLGVYLVNLIRQLNTQKKPFL